MSMSDDPRDFRRGQGGGRDYGPPQQGQGGRGAPPANDRYDAYRDQEPPSSRGQPNRDKPQPTFSAYRPEAYANQEPASPSRAERAEWDKGAPRTAPPPPPAPPSRQAPPPAPQQADPYGRAPGPSRDPYYQDAPSDPYASRSAGGYDQEWGNETHRHSGSHQFPSYYPPSEDAALGPDAQSLHDRFFSPEPGVGDPLPAPPQARYHNTFEEHDHGDTAGQGLEDEDAEPFADQPGPGVRREPNQYDPGFDNGHFEWDQYDQAPPPSSARPFHPPAIADEDLDADFFADEDDYDADDYEPERKGGRKKLMAAVLVGAVVVGGGLAYVYKFSGADGTGSPSLISADNSPVKEEPTEPGGRDFPNGNKLIYDRLGGEEGTTAARLAGGESTAAPQSGESSDNDSSAEPIPGIVTTGGTLEERIENALKAQGNGGQPASSDTANESANKPRTVKTVTFGPDGNPQPAEPRAQRIAVNDPANENLSSGVVISTAQTVSAANEASADQPDRAAQPEETQVASVSPQPQTPEITESSGGTGSYFVQIGARNDREAAIAAFATLQQKYSSVIGNYAPSVRKADLGAKGVWYRLLVGPVENKTDADALCQQLKGAGMKGCFARKD